MEITTDRKPQVGTLDDSMDPRADGETKVSPGDLEQDNTTVAKS